MSSAIRTMLLDTNVWIDYYLGYRSNHVAVRKLMSKANHAGIDLLHAVTSTKDVFFLIAADFKREARSQNDNVLTPSAAQAAQAVAWGCLQNMEEISTPVGCDQSDVWLACKQRSLHADFEDNLIVAAALRSKASLLVTNDEMLIRHSPVATPSVEDALKVLPEEVTQGQRGAPREAMP